MSKRNEAYVQLKTYFEEKGRVLTAQEYSRETDTPIRFRVLKNLFGSWSQVERLMRREFREDNGPETDIAEVLAARNNKINEAQDIWVQASENQDKKSAREAEAQALGEKLALNASTPEGANANKIAIGGPLPEEQAKLERMGATVNINPVTMERAVADPNAKTIDPMNGVASVTGKTPVELVVAAREELAAADVKVGHATDGGSQGSASVAALGDGKTTTAKTEPKKA